MELNVEALPAINDATTSKPATSKVKFSSQLVDRLLDKLAGDDVFRALFKASPETALMSIGADHDVVCGLCARPSELVSKEQVRQARTILQSKLLGESSHLIFTLEAGCY